MADAKELEKIELAEEYFRRYFEMENAVTVNEENMEYLKTYIHDDQYVTKNFNMMDQTQRGAIITAVTTVVMLLLMGVATNWLIAGALAIGTIVVGVIVVLRLNKYRLDVAKKEQHEVNEGIREQIVLLEERKVQLERQKDDYYKALGKRVDVPLDYMKNVSQIKKFMTDGEADTVEDAIAMYEQSMLMQQMSDIMMASKVKEEEPKKSDRERFGDPLKIIKENKRKRRKEKKAKK